MAKRASLSEQAERKLRLQAAAKVRAGKTLTSGEMAALKRYEKEKADEARDAVLRSCPKHVFVTMTGKPTKVVNDMGARYGLTVREKHGKRTDTVDLGVILTELFELLTGLSRNPLKALAALGFAVDDESLAMAGADGPSLERWRAAKAVLAELDVAERRKNLVPRTTIHAAHVRLAALIRGCGAKLQKQCGPEARDILEETLDAFAREIDSLSGDGNDDPSGESGT